MGHITITNSTDMTPVGIATVLTLVGLTLLVFGVHAIRTRSVSHLVTLLQSYAVTAAIVGLVFGVIHFWAWVFK